MKKKLLVVGFSVSGGDDNFIDRAAANAGSLLEVCDISRCAIGGLPPAMLCYLLPGILDRTAPDAVVLEIASHGFRQNSSAKSHRKAVDWLLDLCARRGVAVGFLDLPRVDVNPLSDWACAIHRDAARSEGLAYRCVDLREGLLWDGVHATSEGLEYYADEFLALAADLCARPSVPAVREIEVGHHLVPVPPDGKCRTHSRYGFEAPVRCIEVGESVSVGIPNGMVPIGVAFLTHPRAGNIVVTGSRDSFRRTVSGFDASSYYERLVVRRFQSPAQEWLTFMQDAAIPDTVPLKGEKDMGARVAYVAGVLCDKAG